MMKIVIAGNMREFWYHMKELVPDPKLVHHASGYLVDDDGVTWRYISRIEQVLGLSDFEVVRVGNWFERAPELLQAVEELYQMDLQFRKGQTAGSIT